MCFAVISYNSNYYIFDSHSCDSLGHSIENGYSVFYKFVTIEHVLNFITKTYLMLSQKHSLKEGSGILFRVNII